MGLSSRIQAWLGHPLGFTSTLVLLFGVALAPAWLFFDPLSYIPRDPIATYRLTNDDFEYCSASRNWTRTLEGLFTPHNTHIVPAWRLVTWGIVAFAGRLSRLPEALATASYGILVAVMLMIGRLVARETCRPGIGLAAMAAVGTSSLMFSAATWYSAGQPLWAGFGILVTLWYLQGWRRSGGSLNLVLASMSAIVAGWLWTGGYLAGPLGAIYLWTDGRTRCRYAAAVPFLASVLAFAVAMGLGGGKIDATVSLHGRTAREAFDPIHSAQYTMQAIPENLVFGNLGVITESTALQGALLTVAILLAWAWARSPQCRFNPLESTGAAMVLGSYFQAFILRGYKPFAELRLVVVPWYDGIPQIGAVLFVAGWCSGPRPARMPRHLLPLTRFSGLVVLSLAVGLVLLNRPRVDTLWRMRPGNMPILLPSELARYPVPELQTLRTSAIVRDRAAWQRRHLAKLEQAEAVARRMGIGRDAISRVFGRVPAPDLPEVYDAVGLLDLSREGTETNPVVIRQALGPLLAVEREPRPDWVAPEEPWPPGLPVQAPVPRKGAQPDREKGRPSVSSPGRSAGELRPSGGGQA
jgi:hypothetical protein